MTSPAPLSLSPVQDLHLETSTKDAEKTLVRLLKDNHAEHSIFWNMADFGISIPDEHKDSGIHIVHTPHMLGAAYFLKAPSEHLEKVYKNESMKLVPWEASPSQIDERNWTEHFNDKRYSRAYLDFFEGELAKANGDWRVVLHKYMFQGDKPLAKAITLSDLSHPLIHLAYAYELQSKEIAMETLALSAIHYDPTQGHLLALTPPTSTYSTDSLYDILSHIRADSIFDSLPYHKGRENLRPLFDNHSQIVLKYYNAWKITNLQKSLQEAFDVSVSLLAATKVEDEHYDFILLHILTACHAVRVILPEISPEDQLGLLKTWWLYTLSVYIVQQRPELRDERISAWDLKGRGWEWVEKQALIGAGAMDVHYLKAIRGFKEASLFGKRDASWYLKAAGRFAEEFDYYGGFGPVDGDMIDQLTVMMGSQPSVTMKG